jgi:hypothetical protein
MAERSGCRAAIRIKNLTRQQGKTGRASYQMPLFIETISY